jgi:hypothetical protein
LCDGSLQQLQQLLCFKQAVFHQQLVSSSLARLER